MTTETPEEKKQRHANFLEVLRDSWIENSMEIDRTYITLGGGGVGILASILASTDVRLGAPALYMFSGALLCFLGTIIFGIMIFYNNKRLVEVMRDNLDNDIKFGEWLDRAIRWTFLLGLVITLMAALITGFSNRSANAMAEKDAIEKAEMAKTELIQLKEQVKLLGQTVKDIKDEQSARERAAAQRPNGKTGGRSNGRVNKPGPMEPATSSTGNTSG
jgi:hypothetical protein